MLPTPFSLKCTFQSGLIVQYMTNLYTLKEFQNPHDFIDKV